MQSAKPPVFDEAASKKLAREIVHELTRGLVSKLEEEVFEVLSSQDVDYFKTPNRGWDEILKAYDASVKQWGEAWDIERHAILKNRPSLSIVRDDEGGTP